MNPTNTGYYVLYVDDEDNALFFFEKGLKKDFNTITSSSAESAYEILKERSKEIAIVITDQRMPGDHGIDLLKHLRANYPDIIRLLTTAYSDLEEAIDSVNQGEVYRYIKKPWNINELKTELKRALELFIMQKERDRLLQQCPCLSSRARFHYTGNHNKN